ncbi:MULTISPECIES: DUF1161 domain-containing protein [Providencia]|uniref:DUF1161 domain-containing protein n=1 Tax=Providencia rettgeri TaxID=587 RepID=A0A3R8VXC6_PRORE|nr:MULTISPECIES: DUF1161 domain-containing protein [Providencia]ELR5074672.1 DUF1161 domain-containing protein [Providencia stuartii]ELR5068640.1 DUF1161 domain-containing protein [Providencia rettgeri]ELR5216630.1 DUF1161 domain-containing protein [Providencia rettgeri]ELR5221520.1 DUF1161 domain-containing protein [Providencia rettgeri]MBV2190857.1 DUF1161 domain-containing protein [Providencia rettgeri]
MKKKLLLPLFALALAPALAQASCESVIEEIKQKIINNGVPADNFSLVAVPNDEVDASKGQVVGHCQNDSYKIIYTRH